MGRVAGAEGRGLATNVAAQGLCQTHLDGRDVPHDDAVCVGAQQPRGAHTRARHGDAVFLRRAAEHGRVQLGQQRPQEEEDEAVGAHRDARRLHRQHRSAV